MAADQRHQGALLHRGNAQSADTLMFTNQPLRNQMSTRGMKAFERLINECSVSAKSPDSSPGEGGE